MPPPHAYPTPFTAETEYDAFPGVKDGVLSLNTPWPRRAYSSMPQVPTLDQDDFDELVLKFGRMVIDDGSQIASYHPNGSEGRCYSFAVRPLSAPLFACIRKNTHHLHSLSSATSVPTRPRSIQACSSVSSPQFSEADALLKAHRLQRNKRTTTGVLQKSLKPTPRPVSLSTSPYPLASRRRTPCSRSSSVSSVTSSSSESSTLSIDEVLATPPSSPMGLYTDKHLPGTEKAQVGVLAPPWALTTHILGRQLET